MNDLVTHLDTQTLVVVGVLVALVPGMVGALVWQTRRTYPGRWVLGNALAALALTLLSLRGTVPDWISIIVANAAVAGGAVAFLQGIRQFRGLPIHWWPECLVAGFGVAAVVWFRYVTDNINARIFAIGLMLGAIGIAAGVTLLKQMPPGRRIGLIVTGFVFIVGGVVSLVRGVYIFSFAPVTSLFDPSTPNAMLFLGASLGVVSWSFGFIVLTGERLEEGSPARVSEPASESISGPVGKRVSEPVSERVSGTSGERVSGVVAQAEPSPDTKLFPKMVSETEVRLQLRRIVESDVFRRSARMERFLTLAVERTLLGCPDELKEYALGRDVFKRGEDYDPRTDSIVRVEAQRLRRKLREFYEAQGAADPVIIKLPSGSYVPIFEYRQGGTPQRGEVHSGSIQ